MVDLRPEDATYVSEQQMAESVAKGYIFHKWIGDRDPNAGVAQTDVLCWKASGEFPKHTSNNVLSVTAADKWVGCQDCLEWMHA